MKCRGPFLSRELPGDDAKSQTGSIGKFSSDIARLRSEILVESKKKDDFLIVSIVLNCIEF